MEMTFIGFCREGVRLSEYDRGTAFIFINLSGGDDATQENSG